MAVDSRIINLENFIKNYQPKHWKEKISTTVFVPYITVRESCQLMNGNYPEKFNLPCFREAIEAWKNKTWR